MKRPEGSAKAGSTSTPRVCCRGTQAPASATRGPPWQWCPQRSTATQAQARVPRPRAWAPRPPGGFQARPRLKPPPQPSATRRKSSASPMSRSMPTPSCTSSSEATAAPCRWIPRSARGERRRSASRARRTRCAARSSSPSSTPACIWPRRMRRRCCCRPALPPPALLPPALLPALLPALVTLASTVDEHGRFNDGGGGRAAHGAAASVSFAHFQFSPDCCPRPHLSQLDASAPRNPRGGPHYSKARRFDQSS